MAQPRHPLSHLRVESKHPRPSALEVSIWAASLPGKHFLAELEHLQMESLFRLQDLPPGDELLREQGVYRGLRAAAALLDELRKRMHAEDKDEDI